MNLDILLWSVAVLAYLGLGAALDAALRQDQGPIPRSRWLTIPLLPITILGLMPAVILRIEWDRLIDRKIPSERLGQFVARMRRRHSKKVEAIRWERAHAAREERRADELRDEIDERADERAGEILNNCWLEAVEAAREAMAKVLDPREDAKPAPPTIERDPRSTAPERQGGG